MANKRPIIIEDDMVVGYPMEGNLVPITLKNLIALGVSEDHATKTMELYKKMGEEVFALIVREGCDKFLNGVMEEIVNFFCEEPDVYHIPEDAQNVSNPKLTLDKTYIDFSNVPDKTWKRIKKYCPDAFHAKWTQYEG